MTSSRNDRISTVPARWMVPVLLVVMAVASGCQSVPTGLPEPLPNRDARMEHGYIYYLDGAGGGTAKKNWAGGVMEGLLAAGYPGAGEMYSWETGGGIAQGSDRVGGIQTLQGAGHGR